jgi:hypothetical protein
MDDILDWINHHDARLGYFATSCEPKDPQAAPKVTSHDGAKPLSTVSGAPDTGNTGAARAQ